MDVSTINSDLIRGNVTTIILKALDDGTSYGYDILKLIEEKTNGKYIIKQPTLYSCLKRLEKQDLITSYMGNVDDTSGARRRYYQLTDAGKEYLARTQAEYEFSRTILDRLLSDKEFDLTSDTTPFDINELRPYTKVASGDDENVKVVEKVVYVDKPVEKIVYVDKPVEKIVYVDRPVEKIVYVDKNNDNPSTAYARPATPTYNSNTNYNNGSYRPSNQPSYTQSQPTYTPNKLPDAPLINRMQDSLRSGNEPAPANENRPSLYNHAPQNTAPVSRTEAQERATKILGIGKYRQDKTINTSGDDDSPSGLKR